MKIFRILPLAAAAFLMASCQNGGGELSESSSQTDSLMYYLGQNSAADYLRQAERDTTLKELSARKAYIEGVKAGLKLLREGDDSYNQGVMQGLNMAFGIENFCKNMEVEVNSNVFAGSLSSALLADTMPNVAEAQREGQRIQEQIMNAKAEKDKAKAHETLSQEAQTAGLPKIADDLYGKVTQKTDGVKLKDGDKVDLEMQFTKSNGDPLNLPLPDKAQVGSGSFPQVLSEALRDLKSGETGEFMTSAHDLTNGRAQQMGYESTDIIKMKIKATLIPDEEKKDDQPKK